MLNFYFSGKGVGKEKRKLLINNLSHSDKIPIEYVSKRDDLIITNADKGGATVKQMIILSIIYFTND